MEFREPKETLVERMLHAAKNIDTHHEWEAQQLRDGIAKIEKLRKILLILSDEENFNYAQIIIDAELYDRT